MYQKVKTKSITTDIILTVWTIQHFEVPFDYEIKEATPLEAYQKLVSEFGGQNVNAIEDPSEILPSDYRGIELDYVGSEFKVSNHEEKDLQVIRF